jgi:predicted lipid-binding transport protein (Tim44 family)
MITKHLTDEEIQLFALDKASSEPVIPEHLLLCEECKAKVAAYQSLFTAIKEQQQPAFDFNLSELILLQLPQPKPKPLPENFFVFLLAFMAILLTGVFAYIFRGYLLSLFAGIKDLLIYLIATTVITVLIVLVIDMYKNYQKKMSSLDFY